MNNQTQFPKVTKKYSLTNSYFKNRRQDMPSSPIEIFQYYKQHGDLPYENGPITFSWFYDCIIEFQKKNGVYLSQFFTPAKTAWRIAELGKEYFKFPANDPYPLVLDACCGFGMLSVALSLKSFAVTGFDICKDFKEVYECLVPGYFKHTNFRDLPVVDKYQAIVSNPPYEQKDCIDFLIHLTSWLADRGRAVLLLPKGFIDKERPKALVEVLRLYKCLHREDMQEDFARTKIKAELVVLEKTNHS